MRAAASGTGQTIPWSEAEDRLLCAIVHEFGSNWFLVADVLSASCAMQGICRSPAHLPLPLPLPHRARPLHCPFGTALLLSSSLVSSAGNQ